MSSETQSQGQKTASIAHLAQEVIARCRRLASFSEDSNGTRRTFLSPPMHRVHQAITGWLEPLGTQVRIDAAGNLRGLYPALEVSGPRLLVGSHLDTVPNAGPYDGVLGVVLAVALIEGLGGRKLPYAIEVVGFSDEEGVRFGTPFIGSRTLVGRLDEDLLNLVDVEGVSVRKAIEEFGLKPAEIGQAAVEGNVHGYVEFHIEQGPVLEKLGLPLAAVDAIAGQSRMEVTFVGRANHAGTTPMELRCDAIAAAAEWINAVEAIGQAVPGLVATVGSIRAEPGVANVIAEKTSLSLDVRHAADEVRLHAIQNCTDQAEQIALRRKLSAHWKTLLNQPAVAMDPFLSRQIEEAIGKTGSRPHRMVSGAGHDAMVLAERIPVAMIFLRTPGGISHAPEELVAVEDIAKAIECGLYLLDQLALSTTFQARMTGA